MRALTIPASDDSRSFSSPFRRWLNRALLPGALALVTSIVLTLSTTASPAKADPPPMPTATIAGVTEALQYIAGMSSEDDDPAVIEDLRQTLLWLLWRLGGNPWELDPAWTPPIGGHP